MNNIYFKIVVNRGQRRQLLLQWQQENPQDIVPDSCVDLCCNWYQVLDNNKSIGWMCTSPMLVHENFNLSPSITQQIFLVYVNPEFRNQGYLTQILKLRKENSIVLGMYTSQQIEKYKKIYQRAGYTQHTFAINLESKHMVGEHMFRDRVAIPIVASDQLLLVTDSEYQRMKQGVIMQEFLVECTLARLSKVGA